MTLAERLDDMRRGVPGCSLVSFGDLSTGLMLRTSATSAPKQDYLESLLHQAGKGFAASDAVFSQQNARSDQDELVIATPKELRVFVRSERNASDVVCCVCDGASSLAEIGSHVSGIFDALEADT